MIKTREQEQRLKLVIRDQIARNPLISVIQLQNTLKGLGFRTANDNPLDWRYVSKLVRKLNREKALAVPSLTNRRSSTFSSRAFSQTLLAAFVSFNSDGFTVNASVASVAQTVMYVAFK